MGRFAKMTEYTHEELLVWEQIREIAGEQLWTSRGLAFSFELRGNELFVDRKKKSITCATVMQALRKGRELVERHVIIHSPKQLGTFGASYLLPLFRRLNLLKEETLFTESDNMC